MKKLSALALAAGIIWLLKLSFDVYALNQQQTEAQQRQSQLEQRSAMLNDQLAAFKREAGKSLPASEPAAAEPGALASPLQPAVLIGQQLDFVEFALKQQQYSVALEKLILLDQQLESYALAPALKASLHQVIAADRQNIAQFVQARNEQQQKTAGMVRQLDQDLAKEMKAQHLNLPVQTEQPFWKRWIQIEPAAKSSAALMQRPLILKEAQLRLLNCQQLLQKGQYILFKQELHQAEAVLKQLPDSNTQHFMQQIKRIKNMPVLTAPVLNTRALIG